jgi:hypothetical protein
LSLYEEAAELARGCADPLTRARAEIGADLYVAAFVPDLPRVRRLEDALDTLPTHPSSPDPTSSSVEDSHQP